MAFSIYDQTEAWLQNSNIQNEASPSCSSTNDLAKQNVNKDSAKLKIYLSDQQSQGRGRNQNQWLNSASGSALLITFSIDTLNPIQPIGSPLIGLAVYEALRSVWPNLKLSIKPPNDIYLENKKLAGLLIEVVQIKNHQKIIIGLGLNVFSIPIEMKSSATCLSEYTEITSNDWSQFLSQLQSYLERAAQNAIATHLSDSQRALLLEAINNFQNQKSKLISVSPFGDLQFENTNLSWRDL